MPDLTQTNSPFKLEDFEYHLPPELIAQQPLSERSTSRLMFVNRQSQSITNETFNHLPQLLQSGDLIVVNDTKVIPARLMTRRATGGQIELLLLRPEPTHPGIWHAMASPIRKLSAGENLFLESDDHNPEGINKIAIKEVILGPDGQKRLLIDFGSQENAYKILSSNGFAPLPPYIHREHDEHDLEKRQEDLAHYQTVFAKTPGAVAAPTAGLHFSKELMLELNKTGIEITNITLHVGPGTFKPISTSLEEHTIESEYFAVSPETVRKVNAALDEGRRVIAVGTTSLRALETAGASGRLQVTENAWTSLYVRPGFDFKIISGLLTNFHLSRSSLLVLVSAFAGYDLTMQAYRQAVEERYRFYSYGDAMLIL